MNQATREYMDALNEADQRGREEVEQSGDPRSYYPAAAGALQAILSAAIERCHGEGIDYRLAHPRKTA